MKILDKLFPEKIADNPRPDLPEDGAIVDTYGWTWHYLGKGTFRSEGDDEHPGPFLLQRQEDRVERTNGGFLLRGWWFLTAPDRYEEEQVGLMTGSATHTEACSFAWKNITGKPWPRKPTKDELARKEITNALDEIELVVGERVDTWNSDYLALVAAREALDRALGHLS